MRTRSQRQQISRTLFVALRAAARPVSLWLVIALTTVYLAPVLAFAAQPGDDDPFICRVAPDEEAPATPAQTRHSCPCPALCGMVGPAFSSGAPFAPAPHPPTDLAEPVDRNSGVRIAFRNGFRPFLRGPPDT